VDFTGYVWDHKQNKQLKFLNSRGGYKSVILMYQGQTPRQKKWFIHRLVALCFIPNPENKPHIDHINRDKDDNHMTNLRWTDHSHNEANRPGWIKRARLPKNVYEVSRGSRRFRVQIMKDRRTYYFGAFDTVEEAETVAIAKRNVLFGLFSYKS
jgi:hypothetical protein